MSKKKRDESGASSFVEDHMIGIVVGGIVINEED